MIIFPVINISVDYGEYDSFLADAGVDTLRAKLP
jgi:hypothetical protein